MTEPIDREILPEDIADVDEELDWLQERPVHFGGSVPSWTPTTVNACILVVRPPAPTPQPSSASSANRTPARLP